MPVPATSWPAWLWQSLVFISAGMGTGAIAALLLGRLVQALLHQVKPADPATFGVATLVLADVALVAAWLPARRASRIDPVLALRSG